MIHLTFKHVHMGNGGVNGVDDKSIVLRIPGWSGPQVFGDSAALFRQNFKRVNLGYLNNDSRLYIEEVTDKEGLTCVRLASEFKGPQCQLRPGNER